MEANWKLQIDEVRWVLYKKDNLGGQTTSSMAVEDLEYKGIVREWYRRIKGSMIMTDKGMVS